MRIVAYMVAIFLGSHTIAGEWKRLPSFPDKEGFAGPFAGVSHSALIVAGGANFPEKKPWDGGRKVWYDHVFVLEEPNGEWKNSGKLPRALGYGVSVTHAGGVVCVGGSDSERHYPEVFRLEWKSGKLVVTPLPPLSKPLANACGAMVGDVLYVSGGQEQPDSKCTLKSTWRIDLSSKEPKWQEVEACPGGGRMLAVAADFDGSFWLMGGVDLIVGKEEKVERRYLKDAYRYTTGRGWQRMADLPYSVVAAPSPAPADASGFLVLGGDDGSQIGVDPKKHLGFLKKMLRYDSKTEKWHEAGELPTPRVTVPCVKWNDSWVVPSGEMRPGIRSPEVWRFTPGVSK